MYFSEPASCKDGAVPIGASIRANGKAKSPPVGGWRWLGEAEPNPVFWWQYMCRKLELDDDMSRSGGSAASQLRKMSLSEAKQKKMISDLHPKEAPAKKSPPVPMPWATVGAPALSRDPRRH